MAYVPPHKRHSKDGDAPLPSPQFPPSQLRNQSNFRGDKETGKAIYSKKATSRWFAVGFDDNGHLPPFVQLQPASLDSIDPNIKGTPLVLLNTHPPQDIRDPCLRSPVEIIMDNVLRDLLSAFEIVSNEMQVQSSDLVKPTLVARFGKILFQGDPSAAQAAVLKNLAALSLLRRSFYTNIPTSYMEKITGEVLPSTEFDFEEEKELFHIKTELHQVRHVVTDISCLVKNLDLRLMLCNRRILTSLTDYEMQHIQDLIQSAVLDPNVKGGLRWHLGKSASGGRFTVIGVWHTITKS